ncbi:MAG: thioredoxin [Candidatus Thermoplasmatota archaeon]|nr:thioredoxin [Candidatus Thermoplasmatota archaeon]
MDDDKELEMIRKRKMESLMREMEEASHKAPFPDRPIDATDLDFKDVISRYELVLVDFWAPWCAPCKMVAPVIEKLSSELKGKVAFVKVNVDENPLTARSDQVMSIPTMVIYSKGRMVDRFVGAQSKAAIEERLRRHMPKSE